MAWHGNGTVVQVCMAGGDVGIKELKQMQLLFFFLKVFFLF